LPKIHNLQSAQNQKRSNRLVTLLPKPPALFCQRTISRGYPTNWKTQRNVIVRSVSLLVEKGRLYGRPAVLAKGAAKKWQNKKRGENPRLLDETGNI
jgi:hypothetical protein